MPTSLTSEKRAQIRIAVPVGEPRAARSMSARWPSVHAHAGELAEVLGDPANELERQSDSASTLRVIVTLLDQRSGGIRG
ncbi:MAG: hypothetical protein QOF15_2164 [Mycobacterium sp.]|nr:hypothetical protein [Mycobacterium sp.]